MFVSIINYPDILILVSYVLSSPIPTAMMVLTIYQGQHFRSVGLYNVIGFSQVFLRSECVERWIVNDGKELLQCA